MDTHRHTLSYPIRTHEQTDMYKSIGMRLAPEHYSKSLPPAKLSAGERLTVSHSFSLSCGNRHAQQESSKLQWGRLHEKGGREVAGAARGPPPVIWRGIGAEVPRITWILKLKRSSVQRSITTVSPAPTHSLLSARLPACLLKVPSA